MGRSTVYAACGASLALGLAFIFVRAPHPWGWEGFDHYHDLGLALARGDAFPTTDVPWGYAYYLAFFYKAFGDRPWIPLTVQVAVNASVPLLVYRFARDAFDDRVAVAAAVATGLLSFNTVYASTQSSDAICTVLFLAAIVSFERGRRHDDWRWHAVAGVLLGVAPQFRPNLILVPLVLAAFLVIERRAAARALHGAVLVAAAAAMLAPWMLRNHRLAGEPIPTSTHGGVQLWYGTLQAGPYLKSRAYNPRRVFEAGSFPYTSLDGVPLIVTWPASCALDAARPLTVEYWTDRDPVRRRAGVAAGANELSAELPPSPAPTAYYFQLERSPARRPEVFFVSADHLGDIDRHGDLLDVFDVVRLMRHGAWNERVSGGERLDFDGDGRLTGADASRAAGMLLADRRSAAGAGSLGAFAFDGEEATLRFDDGSTVVVPRRWSERITDVDVSGGEAARLLHTFAPFPAPAQAGARDERNCDGDGGARVNTVFYRAQPHEMRRYIALALDNIRRNPAGYAAAVAYRAVRVFFIEGTDDPRTAQQFDGSRRVYAVAHAASIGLLALAVAGAVVARRRGYAIALPLVLIGYIPATLAFVLTNMRYSVTVQPLLFMFVAVAVLSALEAGGAIPPRAPGESRETLRPAGAQTAHRP